MKRFIVVLDGFGDKHATAVRMTSPLEAAGAFLDEIGLTTAECSPIRFGTAEASDAGAARLLPDTAVRWIGSISFEAT